MTAGADLHAFGRSVLTTVWPLVTGAAATLPELQIAGAVALHESTYGKGWKGPGAGSNNWGAVICGSQLLAGASGCPAGCFPNLDSSPGKPAEMRCFKAYPTPEDGAAHVVKLITLKRPNSHAAMLAGDIDAFSRDMHATHYYEGTSLDPEVNIDTHARKMEAGVQAIAKALGEPVAAFRGGASPTGGGSPPTGDDDSTITDIAGACILGALAYATIRVWKGVLV